MFEREYRDLSFVPRWSIIRTIKDQNVAEHSFYVALYAEQLARYLDWRGDMGVLLTMALRHDLEECFTSDIPGPAKSHFVDKARFHEFTCKELNNRFNLHMRVIAPDEEKEMMALIKIADGLDEVFYLASERQMGNTSIDGVFSARVMLLKEKFLDVLVSIFKRSSAETLAKWGAIEQAITNHKFQTSKVVMPK